MADDTDPADEHTLILMRVASRITHLQREALNQLDPPLGITQYGVLARLGRGTTSMASLRVRSTVTFSTLSEATSTLVRHGLVDRVRSEQDRRSVDLSITEDGRRLLARAQEALDEIRRDLTDGLPRATQEDLETFWYPFYDRTRRALAAQQNVSEVVDADEEA